MMRLRAMVLIAGLSLPAAAWAALGQNIGVPGGAASAAGGSGRAMLAAPGNYSVQQSQDAAGRVIKQYVAADGTVFAVSWSGKGAPDMQELLASYFPAYLKLQQTNRSGLNRLRGESSGFVVESQGRMGTFAGIAYDLALFPAGLTPAQLK